VFELLNNATTKKKKKMPILAQWGYGQRFPRGAKAGRRITEITWKAQDKPKLGNQILGDEKKAQREEKKRPDIKFFGKKELRKKQGWQKGY